ncbi:MAG: 2-hydroxyglutaryl-CoA dehydratase [Chloroflexales bacterium]|nr:2-hydroxyglutaryl-CoA dehydratase [Chloroflexales bacterium]
MSFTMGIDVGSTYTKAVILHEGGRIVSAGIVRTGFRLPEAAAQARDQALAQIGLSGDDIAYTASTGFGRYQVPFTDVSVTDLTAQSRGARFFFPETRTVLDVGGQTMKASRLDGGGKIRSFRLNDKCAAGTGAFLEKTAYYMGYSIEEIGPLIMTSKDQVPISSVCAVFAESEVINHVSTGCAPADIMHGAVASLVDRSVQLMKRVQMEPQFTLVGGIMRFETMIRVVREKLGHEVNVPPDEMAQFTAALGAAVLAYGRLLKLPKDDELLEASDARPTPAQAE